jgi:uncharacterized protein YbjT (DUF2867 family)
VLVAGATGRLGAIVDALLARGHTVRAITRDLGSTAAERLREKGVEVVFGDRDDLGGIERSAREVDAVFATGTAHRVGPDGELRHGQALVAAVTAAEVPHLVYGSGDGAAADSPLALFRVKHQIEQRIRAAGVVHTILAPVYFMENLFNPWNVATLRTGTLPSPIRVDLPLQQVAIADLVAIAVLAIERPAEFAGERITIASDELTATDAADALSRVTGRRFDAEPLAAAELDPGPQPLFGWLERAGHEVDIAALRSRYPDVGWHSYEAWLRSQRPRLSELCRREHADMS